MSRWLDHADALKAHLEATVALCGTGTAAAQRVPVLVDRTLDVESEAEKLIQRGRGSAVVIAWTGARNPDRRATRLRMGGSYSLLCMTNPNRGDDWPVADELADQVATAAHGWVAADGPNDQTRRMEVTAIDLVPNTKLLIYEISAEVLRVPG